MMNTSLRYSQPGSGIGKQVADRSAEEERKPASRGLGKVEVLRVVGEHFLDGLVAVACATAIVGGPWTWNATKIRCIVRIASARAGA